MESFHEHFVIYVIEIVIVIFVKELSCLRERCASGGGGHEGVPKND